VLLAAILSVSSVSLTACKDSDFGVKIYAIDEQGLVRKDDDDEVLERKTFEESKGYLCTSPSDMQTILQIINECLPAE